MEMQGAMTIFAVNLKRIVKLINEKQEKYLEKRDLLFEKTANFTKIITWYWWSFLSVIKFYSKRCVFQVPSL